jgi:hypothetical protein
MSTWRDQILKEFTPKVARLTLVADPDGLLLEEGILEAVRERGFELIPFKDHITFRYAYETKYRSQWDRGEQTDLVVVLRSKANDLASLPYDLLRAGRKLFFNLGDIFPNLSYPVVTVLDRADLDALFQAQERHAPGQLGDNATKEFILRHVFEIASELIKQPSDLLRVLLRRHYRGQRIPVVLDERLILLLRQNSTFDDWPLEAIVPDREAFFAFLQERWPIFLGRTGLTDEMEVRENDENYSLRYPGPAHLPFDHHDVRVYLDTLFLEGILQPVSHERGAQLARTWAGVGVKIDTAGDRQRRVTKLVARAREALPTEDARYGEWLLFARTWAELIAVVHEDPADTGAQREVEALRGGIDNAFAPWLARRYSGLINLPVTPPVMLHHLARSLAHKMTEDKKLKMALVVVDGLSLDQWLAMRPIVATQVGNAVFRESAAYAWVPTITSVSRQTIFAGRPPFFFPGSIHSTEKEPYLWGQLWADQGLLSNEIAYAKGLGDGDLDRLDELLSHPKLRIAGLILDKVDKIMHGMELGTAGMHGQIRQWARQGCMGNTLNLLLDHGFDIVLTSDHGNIETRGCGRVAEGAMANMRGERVRIYSDSLLRDKIKDRFPMAKEWPPIGLPADFLPLLAPDRESFVSQGDVTVTHGGASMEEVIVPLVHIARKDR